MFTNLGFFFILFLTIQVSRIILLLRFENLGPRRCPVPSDRCIDIKQGRTGEKDERTMQNRTLFDAVRFTPETGKYYKNVNGITYECRVGLLDGEFDDETAWFVSPEGWAFKAIGCCLYPDGCIEWDRSAYRHWIDSSKTAPPPST